MPVLLLFCTLIAGAAEEGTGAETAAAVPLRGVVLRQALSGFVPEGVPSAGLDFSASTVATADPVLRDKVTAMLGQPVTLRLLQGLTAEVVLAYRRAGRPLADAAVPAQNISNGTVQVIVLEAHLGRVSVEGASRFSAERIQAAMRTRPGEPLVAGTVFSDLDWLNRNPFRRIDLVYARGADLGTTDVVLRVTERRPWEAFAGYDNGNLDSLGRDRWFAGLRLGNLWAAEHQLNVLYTRAHDTGVYQGVSADYTVPFPWRHLLTVNAALAEPTVRSGVFDSVGRSWRLALRYGGEFPRTRLWEFDWNAGYEARSTDNDILFGGTTVFSGAYETHEFLGEFLARRPGPAGESNLKAVFAASPGGIGGRNSSADLSGAGRDRVSARYAYADFSASHRFPLPRGCDLTLAATARLTSDRLPSASQYALGGMAQLPGYGESTVTGDGAWWAQVRLQSPVFAVLRTGEDARADAMRVHLVGSVGAVSTNRRTALDLAQGVAAHRELASLALGATYELARHLQLNFAYGWQLRAPAPGAGRASRGHVSIVANY